MPTWYTRSYVHDNSKGRYEAKTKVVTFRVAKEEYQQLEEVKMNTGLSNADLIMLGAGIAREKREARLVPTCINQRKNVQVLPDEQHALSR